MFVLEVANDTLVDVDARPPVQSLPVALLARTEVSVRGGHTQVLTRESILLARRHIRQARAVRVLVRAIGTVRRPVAHVGERHARAIATPEVADGALGAMGAALLVAIVLAVLVAIASPRRPNASTRSTAKLVLGAKLQCCNGINWLVRWQRRPEVIYLRQLSSSD